jgi:hypothetical protein
MIEIMIERRVLHLKLASIGAFVVVKLAMEALKREHATKVLDANARRGWKSFGDGGKLTSM